MRRFARLTLAYLLSAVLICGAFTVSLVLPESWARAALGGAGCVALYRGLKAWAERLERQQSLLEVKRAGSADLERIQRELGDALGELRAQTASGRVKLVALCALTPQGVRTLIGGRGSGEELEDVAQELGGLADHCRESLRAGREAKEA